MKKSYEYGGDYDAKSRKVRVARSETQYSAFGATGEAIKSTGFHKRKDSSGRIVGSLWHTHPWETQEGTYQRRYGSQYRLEMNCLPSADDNAVVLKTSLAEKVDGKGKEFLSSISASGFISETIAEGIRLDIKRLRELDCDEQTIQNLLGFLTFEPPTWFRNYAKKNRENELMQRASAFYKRKLLFDGSFYREIESFIEECQDLFIEGREFRRMTTTAPQVLKEEMYLELAEYPDRNKLKTMGFKIKKQQDAVLEMLGMRTSIYKVGNDGKTVPVLESVFSCDVFDEVKNLQDIQISHL